MSTLATITKAVLTPLTSYPDAQLSTHVIHLLSGSFTGTITVKGRAKGTTMAYVAIPYKKRFLNGAVGDDSYVSTGITDTSLIEVNSAGLDVALDTTAAFTSGSMLVSFDVFLG